MMSRSGVLMLSVLPEAHTHLLEALRQRAIPVEFARSGAHALRKLRQRYRTEDVARLYQIEIIKLRVQIQEMSRIDHAVLSAGTAEQESSDTMTPHA